MRRRRESLRVCFAFLEEGEKRRRGNSQAVANTFGGGVGNTEPRPAEMKESTIPLHLVLP